jgi:peptidyl-Lys metalloendopeptidase
MSNSNNISSPITVRIELNSSEYKAKDRQNLTYTLVNNSDVRVNVLKWHTPIDGIEDDIFKVEKQENLATYLGLIKKRGLPRPEDYVTIDPKGSISTDLDLTEVYDISQAGSYTVEFVSPLLNFEQDESEGLKRKVSDMRKFTPEIIRSNTAKFKLIEDRESKQERGVDLRWIDTMRKRAREGGTSSFQHCSTSQTEAISEALSNAKVIASESLSLLSQTPEGSRPNSSRYKEWFGEYDGDRYNKVALNFNNIHNTIVDQSITFNCSFIDCDASTYAYVYAVRPYEIFLCNLFWNAPMTGTDSKSGTIIHELSHFNIIAGTRDSVYSQNACRQLAIDNPSVAISTADNHEYFAENTPQLPN